MKNKYKDEMRKIVPTEELISRTKTAMTKENYNMKKPIVKRFSVVAVACIAILVTATTAFATWHFTRASDIADLAGNTALSSAFEGESAININQTIATDNYIFTLLAIVSGQDISDHPIYNSTGEVLDDRTYAVLAIQKADGSPMPQPMDDDFVSFTISPFVRGKAPWQTNIFTLYGGHITMVVDGVMYFITDFTNIEIYADIGVYLGITTGQMIGGIMDSFTFDETTGEIDTNPDFDGTNVIFTLPFGQ